MAGLESNPGPTPTRYPCTFCNNEVTDLSQRIIACNQCDRWAHKSCLGLSTAEYDQLNCSSGPWFCPGCGNPNHSTILYDIPNALSDSIGSIYSSDSDETCSTPGHMSTSEANLTNLSTPISSIGSPTATSSPKPQTSTGTNQKKPLRIVTVNFQSIRKKGKNIDVLVETVAPDIIIGTETWLSSDISSSEFFNPKLGYNIFRNDRKSDAHGGVLLAVKNNLQFTNINTSNHIEFISGTLELPKKKQMIIGAYYRPPDRVDDEYLSATYDELSSLRSKNRKAVLILSGDFNTPDIQWSNNTIQGNNYPHRVNQCFLDIAHDLALEQMVDFPTRANNTLDLTFTSHPGFMKRCKPLPPIGAKSDHDVVLFDTSHEVIRSKPVRRKILLWNKVDQSRIKEACSELCKSFFNQHFTSLDNMWSAVKTGLLNIMEAHVPTKLSSTRFTHPWVNTATRRLSRRKSRAYKKAKHSNSHKDWNRYRSLKAESQREMRKAHRSFIQETVDQDLTNNSKRFFSYIKSKRQETTGISPLLNKDGFLHSNNTNKAEILNQQFHSVFTKEDLTNLPDIGPSKIKAMEPIKISIAGVRKLLKKLKPHKASGPDGIPNRLLSLAAEELAPILTKLFQTSLDTGTAPADWKEALVTPIYKKGPRNMASNYRPVSLTSVVSKLLEHIIFSSTMK